MFRIKTVAPEAAEGMVAEIYGQFPPGVGVPHAIRMMSASPEFLARKVQDLKQWHEHETITAPMQKAMRMLISAEVQLPGCQAANATMLELGGLTAEQVATFSGPVEGWPLGEKANALVHFVVTHVTSRRPAAAGDLDRLRDLGWSDAEIFEGMAFGGMVLGVTSIVAVLKE